MQLTSRESNILKLLLMSNRRYTVVELARKLEVSSRSIYTDLLSIERYLQKEFRILLVRKETYNYLHPEDIQVLKTFFYEDGVFSNLSRKYQIIEFLIDWKTTTLQEIGDTLFLSKSTVNIEMKNVEKLLNKFSLHLIKKPYHGLLLTGNELNVRFMMQYMTSEELEDFTTAMHLDLLVYARRFLNTEDLLKIQKQLRNYPELNSYDFFIALGIMSNRIKKGHHFYVSEEIVSKYTNHPMKRKVEKLLAEMMLDMELEYQKGEVYYLLINLQNDEEEVEHQAYLEEVIQAIMSLIQKKYHEIDIDNQAFHAGMMLHITMMMKRNVFGKINRNPILEQTKESLPFAFNIAADIGMMLASNFSIFVNEDEIGLLAMHIQSMIEESNRKNTENVQYIVASHIGYGNARMISSRLLARFPQAIIKQQLSIIQLEAFLKEGKIDQRKTMILSTAPLSIDKQNYVQIKPLIDEGDMYHIKEHIEKIGRKQISHTDKNTLAAHLLVDHIYLKQQFTNKEELLNFVCQKLFETGHVTQLFFDSTLDREKISSTYANNGVALPHGYSKHVNKPGISIVILDKSLNWDGYYVDIVFVCALSLMVKKSDKMMFEEMYEIINDKKRLLQLKNAQTGQEVIDQLKQVKEK